jgi:hypothetical protein
MNLSQRLDQARAMRARGDVDDGGPTSFDLRLTRDEAVYDGHNLRTGEEMTEDTWRDLQVKESEGLPAWNPTRANELVTIDLTVDITPVASGADVIDLRGRERERPAPTDEDVFEMPAWARGEHVFKSTRE